MDPVDEVFATAKHMMAGADREMAEDPAVSAEDVYVAIRLVHLSKAMAIIRENHPMSYSAPGSRAYRMLRWMAAEQDCVKRSRKKGFPDG